MSKEKFSGMNVWFIIAKLIMYLPLIIVLLKIACSYVLNNNSA